MNERGPGDNIQVVDFARDEVDRLKIDYACTSRKRVDDLVAKSAELISKLATRENRDVVTGLIKDMRDAYKRINGVRESEVAPHLERQRGANGWFGSILDKLGRKDKKAKEGQGDRLGRLLTEHDAAVLAAEQERRRREAEAAAKIAREKQEAEAKAVRVAAEAARVAEEARQKSERARTEESRAARAAEADAAAEASRKAEEALSETRVNATGDRGPGRGDGHRNLGGAEGHHAAAQRRRDPVRNGEREVRRDHDRTRSIWNGSGHTCRCRPSKARSTNTRHPWGIRAMPRFRSLRPGSGRFALAFWQDECWPRCRLLRGTDE